MNKRRSRQGADIVCTLWKCVSAYKLQQNTAKSAQARSQSIPQVVDRSEPRGPIPRHF